MTKVKKLVISGDGGDTSIYSLSSEFESTFSDGSAKEPAIKLFASRKDASWTSSVKGKKLASLKCYGNGVVVTTRGKPEVYLDYCQLFELELLIKEYRLVTKDKAKLKTVKLK